MTPFIHRQETMSFLGFPIARFIDIEDSERLLRAIRLTDEAVPIELILGHDYSIRVGEGRDVGLAIATDMPKIAFDLMQLFPQASRRRPSIDCIPVPHGPRNSPDDGRDTSWHRR
jgi:hypothetical protein